LADAAQESATGATTTDITRAVQTLLADQGFFAGTVDGQPGPATKAALADAFAAQGRDAPTGDVPTFDDLAILAAV
jgi:peptidoglycan hydrolase-like protein with peptidoglycan-binding domain